MRGDFSRLTFDPTRHYSAVLVQQGRVTLDADANEATAIGLHLLRTFVRDVIGAHGGPADHAGFGIEPVVTQGALTDFTIGKGHYYVEGLLLENDRDVSWSAQPDPLVEAARGEAELPALPLLVYLRVFERLVTALEVPGLRELALGMNGPDTTGRAQVVWQVIATHRWPGTDTAIPAGVTKADALAAWGTWEAALAGRNRGQLKARARGDAASDEPCIMSPEARYRGPENQLYRVEVHRGGKAGTASFKWSRDNGSVAFGVESVQGDSVVVTSLGRDVRLGLEVGDWVELVDDRLELHREPGQLRRVLRIDLQDRRVTLEPLPGEALAFDAERHPRLRRWDQREGKGRGALGVGNGFAIVESASEAGWIELEDGVAIQFQPGGEYEPGDYWLIPARTTTGDIEWPRTMDKPDALPPRGATHHYAPLALVRGPAAADREDLRRTFDALAK